MTDIPLPDDLAEQLEAIARRENRSLADVVALMVEQYNLTADQDNIDVQHPLDAFLGIYEDDIANMSISVRETIQEHFRKNDRPD